MQITVKNKVFIAKKEKKRERKEKETKHGELENGDTDCNWREVGLSDWNLVVKQQTDMIYSRKLDAVGTVMLLAFKILKIRRKPYNDRKIL